MTKDEGGRLRAALGRAGRPYPARLRERATTYATERKALGIGLDETAKELSVARATLRSWLWRTPFRAVEIEPTGPVVVKAALVLIDERSGVRVEGLGVDGALEIIRGLR
jgi:hypothetical protein